MKNKDKKSDDLRMCGDMPYQPLIPKSMNIKVDTESFRKSERQILRRLAKEITYGEGIRPVKHL